MGQRIVDDTGLADIVDLGRYPIDRPHCSEYRGVLDQAREEMRATGCTQLKGFVRPEAVVAMCAEVDGKRCLLDYSSEELNPYFTPDDPALPEDHPVRTRQIRRNWWLCRDRIDTDGLMTRLFESDTFLEFVRGALGANILYRHGDPMSAFLVNVQSDGDEFPWHFDSNETSISILLRKSTRGGRFEYAPNLRTEDDPNFEDVSDVLKGRRDRVLAPDMEPGDLQIFAGRYSLHRVTQVEGAECRYSLILGYANTQNLIAAKSSVLNAFGRSHPIHDQQSGRSTY